MGGDWAWYLGAGAAGLAAVWLLGWAWWGDRSCGRARCGRCWYSLETLVGNGRALPTCPECGWRSERKGRYYRSRRRKGWAAVAVALAIVAVACGLTPKAQRDGVWAVAPTWVMWGVVRSGRVPSDAFAEELARRVSAGDALTVGAERVYRWTPRVQLTRSRGVAGIPLRGRFWTTLGSNYLHAGFRYGIQGWLVNDADVDAVQSHENWWTPTTHVLRPSPSVEANAGEYATQVECLPTNRRLIDGVAEFTLRVPLEGSIDRVMTPVSLGRESVLGALKPRLFVLPTTTNLALSVGDVTASDVGGAVALGMKVEILRKGEVVSRGRWFQSPGEQTMAARPVLMRFGPYDPVRNVNGPMTCSLEDLLADGCVVRFSTDEEMALAALECEKYWRGSFEVPLKELVK